MIKNGEKIEFKVEPIIISDQEYETIKNTNQIHEEMERIKKDMRNLEEYRLKLNEEYALLEQQIIEKQKLELERIKEIQKKKMIEELVLNSGEMEIELERPFLIVPIDTEDLCVEVLDWNQNDGAKIVLGRRTGKMNQQWIYMSNGCIRSALQCGKAMSMNEDFYLELSGANQKMKIMNDGHIIVDTTLKALDIEEITEGHQLCAKSIEDANSQKWKIMYCETISNQVEYPLSNPKRWKVLKTIGEVFSPRYSHVTVLTERGILLFGNFQFLNYFLLDRWI